MGMSAFISTRRKSLVMWSLLLIFFATFPLYGNDYHINLLTTILMYTVLTVSWVMFSGATGYMSLATAAFFGIGIMATAYLEETLPFPVIIVIGGLLASALAFLIGLVTLRLKGIYFAIFTFGFVMFVDKTAHYIDSNILGNTWGHDLPLPDPGMLHYVMLGLVVVTLFSIHFIRRSRYGLALLSIGGNEEAANTWASIRLRRRLSCSPSVRSSWGQPGQSGRSPWSILRVVTRSTYSIPSCRS